MMSWLFGGGGASQTKECTLILQPDVSARILPGFKFGDPLNLTGNQGDTVGMIMDRFNMYRSPDSQINTLWKSDGSQLSFATPINGSLVAIVKA